MSAGHYTSAAHWRAARDAEAERAPDTSGRPSSSLTAVQTTIYVQATDAADATSIVHRALESALMEGFAFLAWTANGGLNGAIEELERLLTSITAHREPRIQEATSGA